MAAMPETATKSAPLQPTSRRTEALALVAGVGTGLALLATVQVGPTVAPRFEPMAEPMVGPMAASSDQTDAPVISLALSQAPTVAARTRRAPRFQFDLAALHGSVPTPRARPGPEIVPALAAVPPMPVRPGSLRPGGPAIALIIDDMGLDLRRSAAVVGLGGRLTLSYLPYAKGLAKQTKAARAAGHELMLHLPMEPRKRRDHPGPNVLAPWLPPGEIGRRLNLALASFDGYVGVNNHMGSLFTANRPAMRLVLGQLRRRNLLFVDSRTGPNSVARTVAGTLGLRFAERDVFLDDEDDKRPVADRLKQLETIAARSGVSIGIGHPRRLTIAALRKWLPDVQRRGFRLVPITAVVRPRPRPPVEQHLTALEARAG